MKREVGILGRRAMRVLVGRVCHIWSDGRGRPFTRARSPVMSILIR
jgi:hypothetical protein